MSALAITAYLHKKKPQPGGGRGRGKRSMRPHSNPKMQIGNARVLSIGHSSQEVRTLVGSCTLTPDARKPPASGVRFGDTRILSMLKPRFSTTNVDPRSDVTRSTKMPGTLTG